MHLTGVLSTSACALCKYVRITGIGRHKFIYLQTHSLQDVHMHTCIQGWGDSASLCRPLVAGIGPYFGNEEDRSTSLYFLYVLTGVEGYVGVCAMT